MMLGPISVIRFDGFWYGDGEEIGNLGVTPNLRPWRLFVPAFLNFACPCPFFAWISLLSSTIGLGQSVPSLAL